MRSWFRLLKRAGAPLAAACALAAAAQADPLSAYLPLNLEPEMERQIERLLILADEPVLKRPFPVELVKAALPDACKKDAALCARVRRYLERYSHDYALTHASATAAFNNGAHVVLPNQHGLSSNDDWELSAQGYVQPSDYLLLSLGGIGYSGRTQATGSMVSIGTSWAQLDAGYRDHWFGPLTDSTMLPGTESPTIPSLTLSNWEPLTRLGFQYEAFVGRLSQVGSDAGRSLPGNNLDNEGVLGRGDPRVAALQLSFEPFPGWSLGVNRLLQFGGGDGLPSSLSFLARAFVKPTGSVQNQTRSQASYDSRFIFPGKVPFAVYFQYAGTQNEDGGSELLGNSALLAGIDFPRLWRHFDLTLEFAEWQNIWYQSYTFLDGTTNDGLVLGNWGADQRNFNEGIGARSEMLRLGWEPPFGGYLELRARALANQTYAAIGEQREYVPGEPPPYPYFHYYDVSLRYSHPWNALVVGGEALAGRDVYGQSFTRISGFVRYGGAGRSHDDDASDGDSGGATDGGGTGERNAEWFVDVGVEANQVRADLGPPSPDTKTPVGVGPHFGLGARRAVSQNNDLGVRLELDGVQGHSLIGVRAIDFRHRFGDSFALGLFAGVDRYNLATPAYSIFAGGGAQWRNVLPGWDLGLDLRYGQNIARDKLLPTDPASYRPDDFYKIASGVLYLSRHF